MADNYPSLGIKADLADLVRLNSQVDRTEESMLRLGRTARKVEEDFQASSRASATTAQQTSTQRIAAAERAAKAEAAAMQQSIASVRERMAFQDRLQRQRQAEEAAGIRDAQNSAREQQRTFEATMAFKVRMARQMAQEVAAQARAEREAVRNEQAAQRREAQDTANFLRGLYRETARLRAEAEQAARPNLNYGSFYRGPDSRSMADIAGLGAIFNTVQNAGRGFMGFLGGLRNLLGEVQQAFFDVRTAVGILLVGMIVSPIINMADAMTGLEARTRIYAERASDVPYTFEQIYRTAQEARVPLEAVGVLYTRLAPLAERLGKSQTDILRVAGTVSKSFSIGGATPAEAASSSQQLAQALGSNRLGGDELRSLAENAPVLLLEISRSLNMNTGEFIKWAHSGKANAEVVVKAIEDAGPRIEAIFKTMPVTISQGITVVGNAITHLVGEVNTATGASVEIANLLLQFAGFLEAKSTTDALIGTLRTLGEVFGFVGKAVETVVDYTPSIAAFIAALAAAAVLPGIYRAVTLALAQLAIQTVYSGQAVTGMTVAVTAGQNAMLAASAIAKTLGTTLAALLTPTNLFLGAIAGGVVIMNMFSNAEKDAAAAAGNLKDSQEGAINAMSNALAFTEKYGIANDNLKKTLDDVIAASKGASGEAKAGVGPMDAATEAAKRRAEFERLAAVNILRRAAADAQARGAEARSAGRTQLLQGQAALWSAENDPFATPAEREFARRAAAETLRSSATTSNIATADFRLAASLSNLQAEFQRAELNPTVPAGGGTTTGGSSSDPNNGMAGAINAIARMRAEVAALEAQTKAISANPMSEFAARIKAAGDEAAAARTAGKASQFAEEARSLGMQKEELQIRLEILRASAQAERQAKDQAAQQKLIADGQLRGASIMQAYFRSGVQGANAYEDALDRVADAEMEGRIAANNLAIAQRYNVTSLTMIAEAYRKATGSTQEQADAVQAVAIREASAAEQSERTANAKDKDQRATDRLTESLRAYAAEAERIAKLRRDADLTPQERSMDASVQIRKEEILAQARKDAVVMTDREAEARARILVALDKQIEKTAQLKITIQDSIRDAFIQSGKQDFSALKKNLTQRIREAFYDALIAKPMTVVVNAVVDVVTKGLDEILRKILEAAAGKNADGSPRGVEDMMKDFMSKMPEQMKAAFKFAGEAFAGYQVGTQVADMFGISGSNKNGGKDQAIMDGAASVIGTAIGGPIGGAIATFLSRTLGKALLGKESNYGANAQFNGMSYTVGGSKSTKETRAAAQGVAEGIVETIATLQGLGIDAQGIITKLQIGTRDTSKLYLQNGQVIQTPKGDPEALAEAAGKALIQYAKYQDPQMRALVDQMVAANSSLEDMVAKLDQYVQAQKLPQNLDTALLAYSNPRAAALAQLQQQQLERRRSINAYADQGFYTPAQLQQMNSTLAALEQNEIADVVKRFADSVDGAVHSLKDFQDAQKAIAEYVQNLRTSALSPLSPEAQLTLSGNKFFQQVTAARAGNFDAMSGITDVASEYLSKAQQQYGSSGAYSAIFDTVTAALDALASQSVEDPLQTAIQDAVDDLTAAIQAGSLAIVDAITGADGAGAIEPPLTNPAGSGGGGGGGGTGGADVANDLGAINQAILDALERQTQVTAAVADAQAQVTQSGLRNVAEAVDSGLVMSRIRGGGQTKVA